MKMTTPATTALMKKIIELGDAYVSQKNSSGEMSFFYEKVFSNSKKELIESLNFISDNSTAAIYEKIEEYCALRAKWNLKKEDDHLFEENALEITSVFKEILDKIEACSFQSIQTMVSRD